MGMYTHLTGLLFIAPEGHTNFSGISLSVSGLSFTCPPGRWGWMSHVICRLQPQI